MRGKVARCNHVAGLVGITPAHAGKSCPLVFAFRYSRDHPRACGEKPPGRVVQGFPPGSPPRMRGKAEDAIANITRQGITPAHAGKRQTRASPAGVCWDHPRTCGEKNNAITGRVLDVGSPPHMRGKVSTELADIQIAGITPAHAGKSLRPYSQLYFRWDHPRTCGEKSGVRLMAAMAPGSPPHMRGKAPPPVAASLPSGITPAHAGKRRITHGQPEN